MQNECLFFKCTFSNPLRRRSLSILVVLLGFLLFHATVIHAADMVLYQVWRYNSTYTVATEAYFNTDSITGSGTESVQVVDFNLLFMANNVPSRWFGDPWYTYWQSAQIVTVVPPWPEKTIIATYQNGVFTGLSSVDLGGNNSIPISPPANWLGENISIGMYQGSYVLYDFPCCAGFSRYWLESSTLESVVQPPVAIVIDIYPNRTPNPVFLSRNSTLYVAVLGSASFDVTTLNSSTVKFGKTGTEASPLRAPLIRDLNRDGLLDAMYGFRTFDCDFVLGDTTGTLTAKLNDGTDAVGSDSVLVSP